MAGGTEDLGVPKLSRALLGQLHKINWSRHYCRADVRVWDLSSLPVLVVPCAAHGQHEVRSLCHRESPCVYAVPLGVSVSEALHKAVLPGSWDAAELRTCHVCQKSSQSSVLCLLLIPSQLHQ